MDQNPVVDCKVGWWAIFGVLLHDVGGFGECVTSACDVALVIVEECFHRVVPAFDGVTNEVDGKVGMVVVYEVEGAATSGGVVCAVVGQFGGGEEGMPGGGGMACEDFEILFERTIGAFSLTISLGVISCGEAKCGANEGEQFFPK